MRLPLLCAALLLAGPANAASDYLKKGEKAKAPAVKAQSKAAIKGESVKARTAIKGESRSTGIIGPSDSKGPAVKSPDRRIIGPSDSR